MKAVVGRTNVGRENVVMSRENVARIIAHGQNVAEPNVLTGKCYQTICFETKYERENIVRTNAV